MHIVHVIQGLSLGGAARALVTCAARCMAAEGGRHSVVSLAPAAGLKSIDHARAAGLEVYDAPDQETLRQLLAGCDIVHVHYWNGPHMFDFLQQDLPPMRLLVKFNIGGAHAPHVITRDIVDFADMIQTTGPFAHGLPVFAAMDPEQRLAKVVMSYGAADFSRLEGFSPRPHQGYNVSYLGTVDFVKMHPDYVAMSNAVRVPEARFVVCGSGDFSVLERQAAKLGASERFEFRKEKEDIRTFLETTDVFGYPLCEDNYSSGELVLQEVAYAGIPAVILPHGGAGLLVVNDFTGYVAASTAEYREAVEHLYHRPDERARLGRNAREYATQLYGDVNGARRTQEIYARLLNLPKRARRFGEAAGQDLLDAPPRLADVLLDEVSAAGSHRFVQSLGESAPQFLTSLASDDLTEALEADQRIAMSSRVLAEGALFMYAARFQDDGFLAYWCALVHLERGDDLAAMQELMRALRLGCDHWRVHWNMALACRRLGETGLSREALARVLRVQPGFRPAAALLAELQEDRSAAGTLDFRAQRDLALVLGDLGRAEDAALSTLSAGGAFEDLEAYYRVGLEMAKAGLPERAAAVFRRVAGHAAAGDGLAAWALFKQGELLLDRGEALAAADLFRQTLSRKPDHAKAVIMLAPADQPLCVRLGDEAADPWPGTITVPMQPLDDELWAYYFSRRKPNRVALALSGAAPTHEFSHLGVILRRHLAPGGEVLLAAPLSEPALAALRQAGLTVQPGASDSEDGTWALGLATPQGDSHGHG